MNLDSSSTDITLAHEIIILLNIMQINTINIILESMTGWLALTLVETESRAQRKEKKMKR